MAASNSPLKPYANSRVLVPAQGEVSLVNGRWVEAAGDSYLVKCFSQESPVLGHLLGFQVTTTPFSA